MKYWTMPELAAIVTPASGWSRQSVAKPKIPLLPPPGDEDYPLVPRVHRLDALRRHESDSREHNAVSHGQHVDAVGAEADLLDDPRAATKAFDVKPDAVAKPVAPDGTVRAECALVLQRHYVPGCQLVRP